MRHSLGHSGSRAVAVPVGVGVIGHRWTDPPALPFRPPGIRAGVSPRGDFLVELLPGQLCADLRGVAHRLAGPLGAVALRIEPNGLRHVQVVWRAADPLVGTVDRARPVRSARQPVMIGRDEQARPVPIDLATAAHLIV